MVGKGQRFRKEVVVLQWPILGGSTSKLIAYSELVFLWAWTRMPDVQPTLASTASRLVLTPCKLYVRVH
eukprot:7583101-Heterocapsa_arctica.AAC.1